MPLVPWHRLVICSHLLLLCGASFARLFVVLSPSGTSVFACFWPCFPCPLFVFGLLLDSSLAVAPLCCVFLLVFLPAILRLSSLWHLCAAFCVVGLPPLFAVFVVLWAAPLPRWLLSPSPLRLFPCGVLVQLLCWSLPLGIWLLHVTARLPCPNAWGVVVLCFLASSCFMAAKAFGPVWGICVTLYTMVHVLLLCSVLLR